MTRKVEQAKWDKLLSKKRLMTLLNNQQEKDGKKTPESRNEFERDCDRIIYSYPFRRLQDKTQVIPFPHHDFVHTRLTHSLEVSTVGRSLGKMIEHFLIKDRKLIIEYGEIPAIVNATCLAHDIGNPPFGHSGEDSISEYFKFSNGGEHILNLHFKEPIIDKKDIVSTYHYTDISDTKKATDIEKFEGNAMGFKILSTLTKGGMNLTCATMAAFAKYPRESFIGVTNDHKLRISEQRTSQKKYGFFFSEREEFKKIATEVGLVALSDNPNEHYAWARHPLAFLMEAADDICYRVIDFEDGCRLKKISFTCTNKCSIDNCDVEKTGENIIGAIAKKNIRYDRSTYEQMIDNTTKISYLRALSIGVLAQECFLVFKNNYEDILNGKFDKALIDCLDKDLILSLKEMKGMVTNGVYQSREVLEMEATGFEVIGGLIETFVSVTEMCLECDPADQPKKYLKIFELIPYEYRPLSSDEKYIQLIKIIDYISGMTDSYAISLYRKIKGIQLPH